MGKRGKQGKLKQRRAEREAELLEWDRATKQEAKRRAESPMYTPFPESDDFMRQRARRATLGGALGMVGELLGGLFS